tara:strand:- start:1401 stop:2006 length:606 start_codon:yes stop_codon:yes gene_type:complete
MRIFLSILILILNLQSLSNANDISEFEIEGMSIGDSLLDYFSKKKIIDKKNSYSDKGYIFGDKDYYAITFDKLERFEIYEAIQIYIKDKDENFTIQALAGLKYYENNINECYSDLDSIEKEFDTLLKNASKVGDGKKRKHSADKSGQSTTLDYYYYINDNNYEFISIICTDWSEKTRRTDSFQVQISSYEFGDFLYNNAYE